MPVEPKLLPLIDSVGARFQSLNVDARLINAFAEKGSGQGEAFVYRRPAFREFQTVAAGVARGLCSWQDNLYAVVGGTLYKNGLSLGAVEAASSYSFTSCLGANPVLFLQNGT